MSVDVRRRILVTDNPRVSAMIGRHAVPGEPRATTLLRLAEHGDAVMQTEEGIMVFSGGNPAMLAMDAADLLDATDLDTITEVLSA